MISAINGSINSFIFVNNKQYIWKVMWHWRTALVTGKNNKFTLEFHIFHQWTPSIWRNYIISHYFPFSIYKTHLTFGKCIWKLGNILRVEGWTKMNSVKPNVWKGWWLWVEARNNIKQTGSKKRIYVILRTIKINLKK